MRVDVTGYKAGYQAACKWMVDKVCMQAVDHLLVRGSQTPLTLFPPVFVGILTAERLEPIVGEDQRTKRTRGQLSQEIKTLQDARRIVI